MRTTTLLLALFIGCFVATAGEVALVIDHRMQGLPLRSDETYAMNSGAWFFKPRFVKYYIAEITVIHDGGKRTALSDVYVLVDALGQSRYVLGSYDVTSVEALEFHIGVDKLRNHLDPTLYPPEHPLALKNPTMHWGWAAGYRFIAVEGSSGTTSNVVATDVQLHAVGNELYRKITMPVSSTASATGIDINLTAEYGALFTQLDVGFGLIFHGYGEETIILSNNMSTRVFSSPTTSVAQETASVNATVWPNPARTMITMRSDPGAVRTAQLIDAFGAVVALPVSGDTQTTWDLSGYSSGSYTLLLTSPSGTTTHVPVALLR